PPHDRLMTASPMQNNLRKPIYATLGVALVWLFVLGFWRWDLNFSPYLAGPVFALAACVAGAWTRWAWRRVQAAAASPEAALPEEDASDVPTQSFAAASAPARRLREAKLVFNAAASVLFIIAAPLLLLLSESLALFTIRMYVARI